MAGKIDRARLEQIFGSVLPETTRDERPDGDHDGSAASGTGESGSSKASDEWIRSQVPPHHG